ncbi:replication initiation and membrane attachment protein [Pullulanibacillus camelliae]|uniref:Replication initiation and membrane attachment protein n=1 Tax=Pullulanibacillus camelliae TaxID=1707096 RepID=A0A8J3E0R4_9BACL|nr:DnaD domain protein [Pullulanibacillus camelliae]GGE51916.1 replication initiation and membrane attachment protein [Pullulanibacillus camelliae]
MQAHWKELLPVDQYRVRLRSVVQSLDLKILNYLYQPLIGASACQLFMTLFFEAEGFKTATFTHHHLMVKTNGSLQALFEDRKLLEAMGLLNIYKHEEKDDEPLIYELVPPLSPEQFFTDGLLNIFLYNRIGQQEYSQLKALFIREEMPLHYKNVTADFNDVFTSVSPSELVAHHERVEDEVILKAPQQERAEPHLSVDFDFDQLYRRLSNVIISKEAFTDEIKEAIQKLSFVYQMGPETMSNIIQRAFLHTGEIDIEQLRKEVRDYYKIEHGDHLPSLSRRSQPETLQEFHGKQPQDDFEKLIQWFETMSPFELLEAVGGGQPADPDLRIVEDILFDQKLTPGVVNVLLDYVMRTNDYKLVRGYVIKIAAHWARKKVKTVREAMSLAKSEHKQYQNWSENKTQPKSRKNTRRAKLPKWMEEEKAEDKTDTGQDPKEAAQREKWLEDYLNNL